MLERIAQDLVFKTLVAELDNFGFPSGKIYAQFPDSIYENTRNQNDKNGLNNIEENRYPALAIYTISSKPVQGHNNPDYQQESYISPNDVKYWKSDLMIDQDTEFCLLVSTRKDQLRYKALLEAFFQTKTHGFIVRDDILPVAGTINLAWYDTKEDSYEAPFEVTFSTCVTYRIYKEYQSKLMLAYNLSGYVAEEFNVLGDTDVDPENWSNQTSPSAYFDVGYDFDDGYLFT